VTSDNSFTDNMKSVSSQYATAAGVETDEDGQTPHIDVPNENQDGEPVDLANVGVPTGAESQAVEAGEDDEDEDVDPDDLTEDELEELTAPEGEED